MCCWSFGYNRVAVIKLFIIDVLTLIVISIDVYPGFWIIKLLDFISSSLVIELQERYWSFREESLKFDLIIFWGTDFGSSGCSSRETLGSIIFSFIIFFLCGSSCKHALWVWKDLAFEKLCLWLVLQRRLACYGCLSWRQWREIIVWNDTKVSLVVVSLLLLRFHSLLFLFGRFGMAVVSRIGCRKVHVSVRSNTVMV